MIRGCVLFSVTQLPWILGLLAKKLGTWALKIKHKGIYTYIQ